MNLQTRYDLEVAQRALKRVLGKIEPREGLARADAAE
jgi:plasmid maintenance system antidote protein VapI